MEFKYQSDTICKITEAMLKVQAEVKTLIKEGNDIPSEKRFACVKLEAMLADIEPKCVKAGVLLKPDIISDDINEWLRVTVIEKESGEFFSTYAFLYPIEEKALNNQQSLGTVITYQFKNLMRVLFAIPTAEEDIDQPYKKDKKNNNNSNNYTVKTVEQPASKPVQQTTVKTVQQPASKPVLLTIVHQDEISKIIKYDKEAIKELCAFMEVPTLNLVQEKDYELLKKFTEDLAKALEI